MKILSSFFEISRNLAWFYQVVGEKYDLSTNEVEVLLFIWQNQSHDSMAEIVGNIGMTRTTFLRMVETLEKRQLILRSYNGGYRKIKIEVVGKGIEICKNIAIIQGKFFEEIMKGFSKSEGLELLRMVFLMRENLHVTKQESKRQRVVRQGVHQYF